MWIVHDFGNAMARNMLVQMERHFKDSNVDRGRSISRNAGNGEIWMWTISKCYVTKSMPLKGCLFGRI